MPIRPKSMSIDEAEAYNADPANWVPDEAPGSQPEIPFEEQTSQLARVLKAAAADEEAEHYQPEDLDFSPGEEQLYTHAQPIPQTQGAEDERAHDEAGEAPRVGLRTTEELDEDMEALTGPYALSIPPELRHLATLRLIEDLVAARDLLDGFVAQVRG